MTGVPCAHIATRIRHTVECAGAVKPEAEALWFYAMNHGVSEIAKRYADLEPLAPDDLEFVEHYYAEGAKKALRAVAYLMLISVREARHINGKASIKQGLVAVSDLATYDYVNSIHDDPHTAQQMFADNPPHTDIVTFTRGLAWQFHNGSYAASYGGPAWGKVADCLHEFVAGTTSAEIMLDTIWTLSHNNGPIFNKGVLYHCHHTSSLRRILDVQRSGQVPQMIVSDSVGIKYRDKNLEARAAWLQAHYPETTTGAVDWIKVQALGALGTYAAEIDAATHKTPEVKAALQKQQEDQVKAKQKAAADDAQKKLAHYQVDVKTKVAKVKREKIAGSDGAADYKITNLATGAAL
jgi:hypothetical protein